AFNRALTVAANVVAAGDITMTTKASPAPFVPGNLNVNPGFTVQSSAGNVVLRAENDVRLLNGSAVQSDSGQVTLVVGFNATLSIDLSDMKFMRVTEEFTPDGISGDVLTERGGMGFARIENVITTGVGGTPSQRFVQLLYLDLLHRGAHLGALVAYADQYDAL